MEEVITNVNWLAVIVGAVLSYALGALWYSQKMFGKKWLVASRITVDEQGMPADKSGMMKSMFAQAFGTFLYAWVIGITAKNDMLITAILIIFAIATLIKANGLFAGKGMYAVVVETTFIIAMGVVMIATHAVL